MWRVTMLSESGERSVKRVVFCSQCNCLRVPWAGARGRWEQVAHARLLGEFTASTSLPGEINQAYCWKIASHPLVFGPRSDVCNRNALPVSDPRTTSGYFFVIRSVDCWGWVIKWRLTGELKRDQTHAGGHLKWSVSNRRVVEQIYTTGSDLSLLVAMSLTDHICRVMAAVRGTEFNLM